VSSCNVLEMTTKPPKTKTLSVIAANGDPHQVIIAGELVDIRFPKGNSLSLLASKLLTALIHHAGIDVVDDRTHRIRLAELNWSHSSVDDLATTILELQQTIVEITVTDPRTGLRRRKSGQFLTDVERDLDAAAGELLYRFSNSVRYVVKNSHHWAAISLRAVLAMEGKYSVPLYQLLALYVSRRQVSETFDLEDLRARLGVGRDKLARWKDFRVRVLEPAVAEICHLTPFTVTWEEVKRGRAVTAVRFGWAKKDKPELARTERELSRPRVGRKARREKTVEQIIDARQAERAQIAAELAALPLLRFDLGDEIPEF
jgi:Initiator Replication protein